MPATMNAVVERASFRTAVLAAVVVPVSFLLGQAFALQAGFYLPKIAGLWCTISAIIVLNVRLEESRKAAIDRIAGTFAGTFFAWLSASLMGYGVTGLSVCIFFMMAVLGLLGYAHVFRIACLTSAIIIIIGMDHPEFSPFWNSLSRLIESIIGALTSLVFVSLFTRLKRPVSRPPRPGTGKTG